MNVALGGSLIQHIPTMHPEALLHSVGDPFQAAHPIEIQPQTYLSSIAGPQREFIVNTSHLQAVDRLGEGLVCNAQAPDGIIEGIESTQHPFCLGVQWHPERTVSGLDTKIFDAFVAACKESSLQHVA